MFFYLYFVPTTTHVISLPSMISLTTHFSWKPISQFGDDQIAHHHPAKSGGDVSFWRRSKCWCLGVIFRYPWWTRSTEEDPATRSEVELIYFSATRLVSSPSVKVTVKEPTVSISQKGKAELLLLLMPRERFQLLSAWKKGRHRLE